MPLKSPVAKKPPLGPAVRCLFTTFKCPNIFASVHFLLSYIYHLAQRRKRPLKVPPKTRGRHLHPPAKTSITEPSQHPWVPPGEGCSGQLSQEHLPWDDCRGLRRAMAPKGSGPELAFPHGTEHPRARASAPGFDPPQELSKPSLLTAPLCSFHQSFTILSS